MKKYIALGAIALMGLSAYSVQAEEVLCTLQYDPVCGQPPMPVCPPGMACAQVMPQPKTYGNACMMRADNATLLYADECSEPSIPVDNTLENIQWAYDKQLTRYDVVDTFKPQMYMSRQEAAALSVRAATALFGRDTSDMNVALIFPYSDNDLFDATLRQDIYKARYLGIMEGLDNVFSPHRSLSRSEALAILIRSIDRTKLNESVTPWYGAYLDRAKSLGLNTIDTSRMEEPISRGEYISWIRTLAPQVATSSALVGTWTLQRVSNLTDAQNTELSRAHITLTFNKENYLNTKICNIMSGKYTATANTISAPSLISTLMACQGVLGDAEGHFRVDGATYTITKNGEESILKITTKDNVTFTYTSKAATTNIIGDWKLIGYNDLDYAKIKSQGYGDVTLNLTDREISAKICNSMHGNYTLSGNTFVTEGLMSTKMACVDGIRMTLEGNFDLRGATFERYSVNFLVATDEPSEQLKITTKAGNVYTFGK